MNPTNGPLALRAATRASVCATWLPACCECLGECGGTRGSELGLAPELKSGWYRCSYFSDSPASVRSSSPPVCCFVVVGGQGATQLHLQNDKKLIHV
jgi:hypothetical protein